MYLGYRLGHIRSESRVFRALVYNKGAAVLHMLRRLVGDEAFFRGLRRFYRDSRFNKAGTEDFRVAMEAESGRSLERFFERWIYGSTLPQLTLSATASKAAGRRRPALRTDRRDLRRAGHGHAAVRRPQAGRRRRAGHRTRRSSSECRSRASLRGVEVNQDDGTLAEIVRSSRPDRLGIACKALIPSRYP